MKLIFSGQRGFFLFLPNKDRDFLNINQCYLTAMHGIVTLCSMLIQFIIFWYYFPETVNIIKHESSCKTIFEEFLAR